jgi:hypothetical protein
LAYAKRHEECVLFLEQVFGTSDCPKKLEEAGFKVVCFAHAFPTEAASHARVPDPRIINHCYQNKYVLVTFDKNMRYTHVETIKKTDIAIIATESGDKYPAARWIDALIQARSKVRSKAKRFPRPWFARLQITGAIRHIETITENMRTRRNRPREMM